MFENVREHSRTFLEILEINVFFFPTHKSSMCLTKYKYKWSETNKHTLSAFGLRSSVVPVQRLLLSTTDGLVKELLVRLSTRPLTPSCFFMNNIKAPLASWATMKFNSVLGRQKTFHQHKNCFFQFLQQYSNFFSEFFFTVCVQGNKGEEKTSQK